MNEDDKTLLEGILTRDPEDLSAYDIQFLNARRDYLNKDQRRVFASVLVDEDAPDILDDQGQVTHLAPREDNMQMDQKTKELAPTKTRKQLSDEAIALGIDGALVKKARTNADIQALIDNPPAKQEEPKTPESTELFSGGNADPDAKV